MGHRNIKHHPHPVYWEQLTREAADAARRDERRRTHRLIHELAREVRRGLHADTSALGLLRELWQRIGR